MSWTWLDEPTIRLLVGRDSNPRTPKRTVLQTVCFNHLHTYQFCIAYGARTRPHLPNPDWKSGALPTRRTRHFVRVVGLEPTYCEVHYDNLLKQIGFTDRCRYTLISWSGRNRTPSQVIHTTYFTLSGLYVPLSLHSIYFKELKTKNPVNFSWLGLIFSVYLLINLKT